MSLSTTIKLREALLYILDKAGSMEIMKLAKLLYLSDYLYARTFGSKAGFMGEHARYEFGPVPVGFYPVYNQLINNGNIAREVNTISLKQVVDTHSLNEQELACIDKVIDEFSTQTLSSVKKAAYSTEPMKSIQIQEKNLGVDKLLYQKMDFKKIGVHPLFENDDVDISFMDDPEFQKNIE